MWPCNFGISFAHGPWGLPAYGFLGAVALLMAVLALRAIFSEGGGKRDRSDSLEIIKSRFARGEISAEEYQRMREILNR